MEYLLAISLMCSASGSKVVMAKGFALPVNECITGFNKCVDGDFENEKKLASCGHEQVVKYNLKPPQGFDK